MRLLRKFLLIILLLSSPTVSGAASDSINAKKYIPDVHGTLRVIYDWSTATGKSQFMVRHARLSATGYVLPFAGYYVQLDLCDKGQLKILDAYLKLTPTKGLTFMAGQMRVPFCVEATRAPHTYFFNHRATVVNFGNLRSVGVKAGYTPAGTPLYFEAGVFNATDMVAHGKWNSALTYSAKGRVYAPAGFTAEVGFMSRVPGGKGAGVRLNQPQAAISWKGGHWFAEAEYIARNYAATGHSTSHAYNFFVDYGFGVKAKWVNRMSFQARFDGITDASNGLYNSEGKITDNITGFNRLTIGATASYVRKPIHLDFRINYEQYFYSDSRKASSPDNNNKLGAGIVLYF